MSAAATAAAAAPASYSAAARAGAPRLLLPGATGLLGREVYRQFCAAGWEVCGVGRTRAAPPLVSLDLFDTDALAALMDTFKPNVVIHCAAERYPDKLEGNEAWAMKINAGLTRTIAELAKTRKIWLVYMSTNYVFDGKAAPYAEDAVPNPVNLYGRSKLEGERAMREVYPEGAIFRVPLLFGPSSSLDESSVTQLVKTIRQPTPRVCNWQERYPTFTPDVARALLAFCTRRLDAGGSDGARLGERSREFAGVFHWQAGEMQTKFSMSQTIAELLSMDKAHLIPTGAPDAGAAPRPQYEEMGCARLERLFGPETVAACRSDFRASLAKVLEGLGLDVQETAASTADSKRPRTDSAQAAL
eukprot:TRINITY_DN18999_c0_g4_i1.p1 TRINITY_DN18999_c0_g4~~TRINITY_DN18999_c0_g4_i1.p1  ORF type:complete len:371 (-),score=72.92 TRINITY_DN18999_c0_g4_i1:73-1149(-)